MNYIKHLIKSLKRLIAFIKRLFLLIKPFVSSYQTVW